MQSIADAVRLIMERRSWSQRRVAQELGVSPSTVGTWRNGSVSNIEHGSVLGLARLLGRHPNELLPLAGYAPFDTEAEWDDSAIAPELRDVLRSLSHDVQVRHVLPAALSAKSFVDERGGHKT